MASDYEDFDDPRSRRTRVADEQSWLRLRARRALGPRLRRTLDSTDLVQQAQAEALGARDNLDLRGRGALRGWLGRIVDNLARQAGRKRVPEATTASTLERVEGAESTVSGRLTRQEEMELLRQRLAALPARTRRVVELKYFDGLSHEEIAQRLEISVGNARVILNRGIAKLREVTDADRDSDGCV
jgi:RNA polymerase sigma factor (sigma-70 family)